MAVFAHMGHALPGSVGIGRLRVPVYGLFATAGLISALMVSERTAPAAGVDRDKLWDAGVAGVIAAFVVSRVLLVGENFPLFKVLPLLVLALPSLTYGGVLLTALFVAIYLRWRGVSLLGAMDAWAPGAALLAAFLELGHFFEGTSAGMPTTLPWGVITPGDTVMGRVHPVQIYGALIALGLALFLYRALRIGVRGRVAAAALVLGGLAAFLLDLLRQPVDSQSGWPLEPSQFVALGAMLAGIGLFAAGPRKKELEAV